MDVVRDEDFGAIWANHFPQWRKSEASRMLLETLVDIMLKREEFRTGQDFDEMLDRVLATFRIPRHEFYEYEREIETKSK